MPCEHFTRKSGSYLSGRIILPTRYSILSYMACRVFVPLGNSSKTFTYSALHLGPVELTRLAAAGIFNLHKPSRNFFQTTRSPAGRIENAGKVASERSAFERLAPERLARERLARQRLASERLARERL